MPSTQADDLKTDLDIQPSDGPILLLGGEGRSARHDFGLWAAAILQQMFPNTRVIVREDPRGTPNPGLDRFLNALPAERTIVVAPPELTWRQLVSIADVLVVTPDSATAIGSILEAMAQKVPVIGTPIECVTELIENGRTGLLARTVTPRAIAARLEEFTNDLTLKERLSAEAYERVVSQFSIARMVEEYSRVYAGDARSPSATANAC
jgi:glycosyltransferase involved in cell wall biosynthesis